MPSYKKILQELYNLEKFGIKLGLDRIEALLKSLGDPHLKYPVIHIGGTNGKGSTSAMLASILQEAGYKVGLYTSPHLVRFNERIKINGRKITDKKIVEVAERIRESIGGNGEGEKWRKGEIKKATPRFPFAPTFFEFTTAMAFLYFAEEKVDIAVIEVGLGGRLDATNVCKPFVSIITNVSKEHEDILGKGIKRIAIEKAGIIKEDGVLITGAAQPSVLKVFNKICKQRNAKFYKFGKDFKISHATPDTNIRGQAQHPRHKHSGAHASRVFNFYGRKWRFGKLKTNLLGRHQYPNAGLALFALEILNENPPLAPFKKGGIKGGFKIAEHAVRKGLENVKLQGRFQIIAREPTIVLDCAHNPAGAKALREAICELRIKNSNHKSEITNHKSKIIFVVGIMADKDIKGFLSQIAPIADLVVLTEPNTPRAAKKETLFPIAKPFAKKVKFIENVKEAYDFAKSVAKKDDIICVTGSFYTIGEVLET